MKGDLTLEEKSCEHVQSACLSGQCERSLLCGRTVASRVSLLSYIHIHTYIHTAVVR